MTLAEYCAYWFVTKRLNTFADGTPPIDAALPADVDRPGLAAALADAVAHAGLRVWPDVVLADPAVLTQACRAARTVFDVSASLLACSYSPGGATVTTADGYADYIVTRWVWRFVWKTEIRVRPLDRELPPNYDARALTLLAEALVRAVSSAGFAIDAAKMTAASGAWEKASDVRDSVLSLTTPISGAES